MKISCYIFSRLPFWFSFSAEMVFLQAQNSRKVIQKKQYKRICFSIFAVAGIIFSLTVKAQVNLDTLSRKQLFEFHLNQLDDEMCCFSGNLTGSSFKDFVADNPVNYYRQLDLSFFSEPHKNLAAFYTRLNLLEEEKLIVLFNYYYLFEREIEAIILDEGLPPEFKLLPPALSAMNIFSEGKNYRVGIWQLTHFQAVLKDARINKMVDERYHPLKSTVFAARQLKKNYQLYNDYNFAVAAFICGNVPVQNALAEKGENASFKDIVENLPKDFYEFIPLFQALSVVLETDKLRSDFQNAEFLKSDTVIINAQLHLSQVSGATGIPPKRLKFFNPHFKHSIIPGHENDYQLLLPKGYKTKFIALKDSVFQSGNDSLFLVAKQHIEYPPEPTRSFIGQAAKDIEIDGKTRLEYMLKTGDVLGMIAEKFDVSVSDLKYWNNIYNARRIRAGQKISVFVPDEKVTLYSEIAAPPREKEITETDDSQIPAGSKKVEYVVKSGESPFVIAQKYDGVTPEAILQWNHINNARKIQIGQKIILYIPK